MIRSGRDISFSLLLSALRGITLWQPVAAYGISVALGMGIWELLDQQWQQALPADVAGGAIFLASLGIGYLGSGRMLIHDAREEPIPGLLQSLLFGVRMLPRLLALMVMEGLLLFGIFIVEIVAFALCRIPGVGAWLTVVLIPVFMVANATLFTLAVIVFNLSGPALWHGEKVAKALQHTIRIARNRPGPVLLMMLLLSVLSTGVAIVIGFILYSGYAMTLASASPVLDGALSGDSIGLGGWLLQIFPGTGALSDNLPSAPGHLAVLAQIGQHVALVSAAALVFILPNIVFLLGMAHLYIEALELEAPEDV